jgi:DNA phosphorothioation-associated putative methyltransferase
VSAEAVDEACRRSTVGKLLPTALYVHRTALDALDPLLRVYEGCARAYLGTLDGANLIKLHRQSGKVSYLVYPDFETDPHPALQRSVKLSLRTREIDCFDSSRLAARGFSVNGHRLTKTKAERNSPGELPGT